MSEANRPRRDFGYWLNIFANLTVVGGIIFLGIEVKQNSQATRAEIKNAMSQSSRDQGLWAAEHPEVLALDERWAEGETLSDIEMRQLNGLYYARWKNLENAYYQHSVSTLDDADWEGYERIIRSYLTIATHSTYLSENGFRFSRNFIEHVESLGP